MTVAVGGVLPPSATEAALGVDARRAELPASGFVPASALPPPPPGATSTASEVDPEALLGPLPTDTELAHKSVSELREMFARRSFALLNRLGTWKQIHRILACGTPSEKLAVIAQLSRVAIEVSKPEAAPLAPVTINIVSGIPRPPDAPPIVVTATARIEAPA